MFTSPPPHHPLSLPLWRNKGGGGGLVKENTVKSIVLVTHIQQSQDIARPPKEEFAECHPQHVVLSFWSVVIYVDDNIPIGVTVRYLKIFTLYTSPGTLFSMNYTL